MLRFSALLFLAATLCIGFFAVQDADARRMGGGKSFGFSKSYSKPAPAKPAPGYGQQRNQAQPGQQQARPGMGGMMGGMLGGLLAGSLLGALFMGGPMGGIGMMDMLLFGGVAFLLFRMLSARRRMAQEPAGHAAYREQGPSHGGHEPSPWDRLRSEPQPTPAAGQTTFEAEPEPTHAVDGFDAEDFLQGAKMAFIRLQQSWDKRDLEDIRQFATPQVAEEIARQAAEDPNPSTTTVLLVEAHLHGVDKDGQVTMAAVIFDATLQEDQDANAPQDVRELWHFIRDTDQAPWKLAGIEQM